MLEKLEIPRGTNVVKHPLRRPLMVGLWSASSRKESARPGSSTGFASLTRARFVARTV
jgi:hypothetical protein